MEKIIVLASCFLLQTIEATQVEQALGTFHTQLTELTAVMKKTLSQPSQAAISASTLSSLNRDYVPRSILIFLDDSVKSDARNTIASSFCAALKDGAGPIIVSASLLYHVVVDEQSKDYDKIDFSQWIVKEVNDALYLLIPLVYPDGEKINPKLVSSFDTSKISDIELQLGLKVNHLKTVSPESFSQEMMKRGIANPVYGGSATYFLSALFDQKRQTSSLFCTRSDYRGKNKPIPLWSAYMDGHGSASQKAYICAGTASRLQVFPGTIVHLSLDDFKKVLDFFEHKIVARLLMYSSCYAAGVNAEEIYRDLQKPVQRTYSFAIVTTALVDAPTKAGMSNLKWKEFLRKLNAPDIFDYKGVVEDFVEEQMRGFKFSVANKAQIKLPGIEWFSVMESPKKIVQLGSTLALTRDPRQPLNIVKYFKADPVLILLWAREIPFELVIDAENLQAIVSMVPGQMCHKIKKISSSKYTSEEILDWFMKVEGSSEVKNFFIEQVNDDLKDVLIRSYENAREAFFWHNSVLYGKGLGTESYVAQETGQKAYKTFLNIAEIQLSRSEKKGFALALEDIQKLSEAVERKKKVLSS